jgi:hypothetical protein
MVSVATCVSKKKKLGMLESGNFVHSSSGNEKFSFVIFIKCKCTKILSKSRFDTDYVAEIDLECCLCAEKVRYSSYSGLE